MARSDQLRRAPSAGETISLDRRTLLIGGGAAAGLAIGWALWPREYSPNVNLAPDETLFNAWLKIARDGRVTVLIPQCEMGQGVTTILPQVMADELGADWRSIAVEPAPINPVYANSLVIDEQAALVTPRSGLPDLVNDARRWTLGEIARREGAMLTMASSSMRAFEQPCREAAAIARMMLTTIAADRWGVAEEACQAVDGFVVHGDKRLRFGELAGAAAALDPPSEPVFRVPGDEPMYGRDVPRLDLPAKLDGSANFAGDIRLPNMAYAAIRHGPHGDTRLTGVDRAATRKIVDLVEVVEHPRWVAAVANNWWAANRALDALAPRFETTGRRADSREIADELAAAVRTGVGTRMARSGDPEAAFAGRPIKSAHYSAAAALHAGIETRTATARFQNGQLQLWVATQAPAHCRAAVARALGVSESAIALFRSFAGGAFGAALAHDVAIEAALIARAVGRPAQLAWSRAEETMRVAPRPPAAASMTATLNTAGTIDGWVARIAVPAAQHQIADRLDGTSTFAAARAADGTFEAAAVMPAMPAYTIPHVGVDHVAVACALPAGRWRSNADSYACFFTESFVDELSHEAGLDPLSYRMAMLSGETGLARCLAMAGVAASWQGAIAGASQGVAVHSMRGSHIALIADARMGARGLQVRRLTAVVDCGRLVNRDIARQQIEGGLIFGLGATVGCTADYRNGLASRVRLRDLKLPRLAQSPEIVVEFVDSDADPGGIGELGVPVVAPAIANALFAATGIRHRAIPFAIGPNP